MATTDTKKKYTYLTKAIQLPDGARKYLRAKTRAELDDKVLKAQILVNAGVDICSEETFGHFAQMWYDLYKKPYLRENSLNAIKYVLNQHILPYIGGYRLRDISPMQIQAIMASLSGKSNSLQSKVLIHLRSIFKAAQENGLAAKSPVSSMLKPGGKKTAEKTALPPGEPPAGGACDESTGPHLPSNRASHGDAPGRDPWAHVGGHRLRPADHPCPPQRHYRERRNLYPGYAQNGGRSEGLAPHG